jgi:hypothetical protein
MSKKIKIIFSSFLLIALIIVNSSFTPAYSASTSSITIEESTAYSKPNSIDGDLDTYSNHFGNGYTIYKLPSDVLSLKIYISSDGGTAKYSLAFLNAAKEQIGTTIKSTVPSSNRTEVIVDVPKGTNYLTLGSESYENPKYYGILVYEVIINAVSTPEPSATPTPIASPEPTIEPTATTQPTETPEQPTSDRAILVITMNTGLEKEFDLPMSEVNAFLNWYDSASESAKYGINKHDNNKGPFSKRTEYVVHDKILTFEVSEYTLSK